MAKLYIKKEPVILRVYYWMPDYNSILQEFVWQLVDVSPELPRVHGFLNYWKNNIEAVIHTVEISNGGTEISAAGERIQQPRFRQ